VSRDFFNPTIVAIFLIIAFSIFSSGLSLIVTFVPGMILAYVLYLVTFFRKLPDALDILPLYFFALAVQFLHFAEEHATHFDVAFPALFNAPPYPHNLFVSFNMVAYFMFIIGGLAIYWKFKPLTLIALFFVSYGVLGNAIAHLVFAIVAKGYFPGLYTSLLYWILAPMLLKRIWHFSRP
jgi:Protein of unknown function with HXXEE motif